MPMRKYMKLIEAAGAELDEGGSRISRVAQHINEGTPFIMISAMRARLTRDKNLRRTEQLKDILTKLPVTFIETEGEYTEEETGVPSQELSFFVMPKRGDKQASPATFRAIGIKLMKAFQQDAILYGDGTDVLLVSEDGSQFAIGNTATFRPEVIADLDGFSKLKGRKFSFTDPETAARGTPDGTPPKTAGIRYGNPKAQAKSDIRAGLERIEQERAQSAVDKIA